MRNEQGITIIELMVVVSIISILIGMSYLGVDFIRKERVNGATRQLLADIQNVRINALTAASTTTTLGYGIRFSAGSYTTFIFNDVVTEDFLYQTNEELNPSTVTLSSSLSLSLLNNAAYPVLIYNRQGFPARYKGDGSSLSLSAQEMDIVIMDVPSGIKKCIKVTENSMREGVFSGGACTQQ